MSLYNAEIDKMMHFNLKNGIPVPKNVTERLYSGVHNRARLEKGSIH